MEMLCECMFFAFFHEDILSSLLFVILFHMHAAISMLAILQLEFFCVQMTNREAEATGIHGNAYQLANHNYSSLGRGKYSGTHNFCRLIVLLLAAFVSLFLCFCFCVNESL